MEPARRQNRVQEERRLDVDFRWITFVPRSSLEDRAGGHHDWAHRGREASIETKIKLSAHFFSRAYLKYNITTTAQGAVALGQSPSSPTIGSGRTVVSLSV